MVAVLVAAALVSLAVVPALGLSFELLLAVAALQGGLSFVVYPLSVAHTNDHISADDLVPASAGLLIAYGAGAVIGPLGASQAMERIGPEALYYVLAATALAVAGFGLFRMTRRAAPTVAEQGPFVPLTRMTGMASELDPRGEEDTSS
jgi:MFS family permease